MGQEWVKSRGPPHEIHRCCDHWRGPRRLGGGRHARARLDCGRRDRPAPHLPLDFRVEKLSGAEQIARFRKTGLAEAILAKATYDGENWIARFGTLLDKAPSQQFGIAYD